LQDQLQKYQGRQSLLKAKYCPRVAAVSCTQKRTKTCDLDLSTMTLKFNRLLEVIEVHVRASFHRAKCSGSWVIVVTEKQKKTQLKAYTVVATADSKNYYKSTSPFSMIWDAW